MTYEYNYGKMERCSICKRIRLTQNWICCDCVLKEREESKHD
jgi:hypothetical protein